MLGVCLVLSENLEGLRLSGSWSAVQALCRVHVCAHRLRYFVEVSAGPEGPECSALCDSVAASTCNESIFKELCLASWCGRLQTAASKSHIKNTLHPAAGQPAHDKQGPCEVVTRPNNPTASGLTQCNVAHPQGPI